MLDNNAGVQDREMGPQSMTSEGDLGGLIYSPFIE